MPFTISHPAVVLPLKQVFPRYFSLTGLMAGAISPDLLYFLILDTAYRGISHSWQGLFMFCLPAGIIFSFAFHKLFKYRAILNLPRPIDLFLSGLALKRFSVKGLRQWLILAYSVLIGALSHFLWDSFTHAEGEIARMIPFLLEKSTILGITRQNCTFLQHFSTFVGGILILIFLFKSRLLPEPALEKSIFTSDKKARFWFSGIAVAALFAVVAVFFRNQSHEQSLMVISRTKYLFKTFGLAGWAGFFYFVCFNALFIKPFEASGSRFPGNDR